MSESEEYDEIVYEEPPYRQVPDAVTFHPDLKDVDVRLFIAFVWFARGGRGAFPGRKALAKKIHKSSVRTVDDAINRLVAAGFLVVVARYHENGGRRSNLYRLFPEPLPVEQRQARPGADPRKPQGEGPEQKSAQGACAENCSGPCAENCPAPEQKSAHEQNETNGKRDEVEGDLAADAASVAATPDTHDGLFPEPAAPAKKRSKATPAPERMEITLSMRQWARDNGITVDLVMETAQFLDHHTAKGSTFRDWTAAWRTWMRNTLKYSPGGRSGGMPGNHLPARHDDDANDLNRRAFG